MDDQELLVPDVTGWTLRELLACQDPDFLAAVDALVDRIVAAPPTDGCGC